MPEYLAPGVYVEEISGGAKPIEAVGTSTACFIGFTEKAQQSKIVDGEKKFDPIIGKPVFLTSWEEYVDTFGTFVPDFYTPLSVYAFFQNGGKRCYVVSLREIPKATHPIISQDGKSYLRIVAKTAGQRGEDLRVRIDPRQLPVKQPKFTLRVQEESWKEEPEFAVTLTENQGQIDIQSLAPSPVVKFSAVDGTTTISGKKLDEIWPDIDENTEFDVPHEFLGSDGQPHLRVVGTSNDPAAPQLKIKIKTDKVSNPDVWSLTVTVLRKDQGDWNELGKFDLTLSKKKADADVEISSSNSTLVDICSLDDNEPKKIQNVDLMKVWPDSPPLVIENFRQKLEGKELGKYLKLKVLDPMVRNKLRVTITKEPAKTPTSITLKVKIEKLAQEEELLYVMKEEDEDPDKIKELKLYSPQSSSLVSLSFQEPQKDAASPKNISLYDAWPSPEQKVTLDDKRDSYHFRSANGKQFLKVTRKDNTTPKKTLEVSIEAEQLKRPIFEIKVERRNEQSGVWKEEERREVTLRRQEEKVKLSKMTSTASSNSGKETITAIKIEYVGGVQPRTIDILPLLKDNKEPVDVGMLQLDSLWPTHQSQTMQQNVQARESTALTLALQGESEETTDELLGPARYDQYQGDAMERTGIDGLAEIDEINFICMPDLMKAWSDNEQAQKYVRSVQALAIAHCDRLANRMVILDPPKEMNPQQINKWRMDEARYDSSRAVLYYPWVEVMDPATNKTIFLPPSGFVAGVWARNDTTRGVHKAPANEVVQLAVGLQFEVGQGHQEILNPIGINCIRPLRGMGIRVWGVCTLSQSDPEWKYINVRRLFHMIEQSIQRSTMWAVFEPNDHRLWAKLRRDVRNFMMTLYSQGMLFGATPGQAFFVKCDEENNPKYTRDLGQVIVDIGVAPSKPAEFVIFRIRQWSPEDEQG